MTLPTGDSFTIVLEREFVRGPVERDAIDRLNAIRPHIARSATMSARLQLERARATTQVLEALGLAALVLYERGKVIAANALIEAMTNEIGWLARDRLSLSDRNADLLLRAAIEFDDHQKARPRGLFRFAAPMGPRQLSRTSCRSACPRATSSFAAPAFWR